MLGYTILYYTILYYTVLYNITLYYTILYCTVLYSATLYYANRNHIHGFRLCGVFSIREGRAISRDTINKPSLAAFINKQIPGLLEWPSWYHLRRGHRHFARVFVQVISVIGCNSSEVGVSRQNRPSHLRSGLKRADPARLDPKDG